MQFINDTWLSTIIGVFATILVAIIIFRMQQKRKGITYEVIANTQVLNLEENTINGVQVMFGTRHVNDARLVVLRVQNSGDEPILPTDYINPIKFVFGKNAEVLEAEVVKMNPRNVRASITYALNAVTLTPVLLNIKDSIEVKVLLTKYNDAQIEVLGRIVGIKRILKYESNDRKGLFSINPLLPTYIGASFALVISNFIAIISFNIINKSLDPIQIHPNGSTVIVNPNDLLNLTTYVLKLETLKSNLLAYNIIYFIVFIIILIFFNKFGKR